MAGKTSNPRDVILPIHKRGDGVYEVESETSQKTYIVSWGSEGDYFSCTCTHYATQRNKLGGYGNPFECKHILSVLAQRDEVDAREVESAVASLRNIAKGLTRE